MKLYKIESKSVDFDEDDSIIVLSTSIERAIYLAIEKWRLREDKEKLELMATEIDQHIEQIVDVSHYGD